MRFLFRFALPESIPIGVNHTEVQLGHQNMPDMRYTRIPNIPYIAHRSLILETNTEIWKFSLQRVNELKLDCAFLGRLGLWGQIVVNFPKNGENA